MKYVIYRIFPAVLLLFVILLKCSTAHETGKSFETVGCSYVTKYCNSCIVDDPEGNRRVPLTAVNCSARNLTDFPTHLPRTTGKLVLSYNTISSLNIEEMRNIPYLKEMLIDENNISFIGERSFENNVMLESLNVGGNYLVDLAPGIFRGLRNLMKLHLYRNRIFRLKKRMFQRLFSLNELHLNGNEICMIEKEAFHGLNHLSFLDLSNNKLAKISEESFGKLASLRKINIGYNQVSDIQYRSFFNLTNLKTLTINHNNLTAVPRALTFLRGLVNLDLSVNPIEFIPMEAFARLHSLEFLNLSFSKVRVFHGNHLKKLMPHLSLLFVHHNPMDCTCDLRWLKQWFEDDISRSSKPGNLPHVKCEYPKPLNGKSFLTVNITDINCSCEYCQKSSECSPGIKNTCKCRENDRAGPSCSDTCQSIVSSNNVSYELMCSSSQGKCFCSNMSEVCENNAHLTCTNCNSPNCVCKPGYHGNGFLNCTDIDECHQEHNLCHKNADCINNEGSFQCVCRNGYQGNGMLCHSMKHHTTVAIVTTSVSFVIFVALISMLVCCIFPKRRASPREGSKYPRTGGKKKKKKKQSTKRYVDLYKIRQLSFTNTVFRQELESSVHEDDWEIPRKKLRLIRAIGEGAFGVVMEGTLDTDEGTTRVAVKTLKPDADRYDYKDLLTELAIMKQAGSHPNIVSLLGACYKDGPLYLVMEFVSGGNLLAFLRSNRCKNPHYINMSSSLNERQLLKIAEDVANGMSYLSSLNLIHRDLAARNVLLTEEKVAKVTDFGLARDVHTEGVYTKTTTSGRLPVKWMAPESIRFHIYTSKSDVWSFGILLWEIITIGECPYPGIPARLLAGKLMTGYRMKKPSQCSDELYEVMRACWQLDTEARPTFAELANILHGILARTGRGYVNLGPEAYNSDSYQIQITVAEIHEYKDEECSLTMKIEPPEVMSNEIDFTPTNEGSLDQHATTML